jgi:predicted nucleic acid-binding protein
MEEVYIDSNVFVYAALNTEKGKAARDVMDDIGEARLQAWTSTLTYDEVCWQLLNDLPEEQARGAMDLFLNLPNLGFINATHNIIRQSHKHVFENGADPRDAIHLASMQDKDVNLIVTEDTDFNDYNVPVRSLASYQAQ